MPQVASERFQIKRVIVRAERTGSENSFPKLDLVFNDHFLPTAGSGHRSQSKKACDWRATCLKAEGNAIAFDQTKDKCDQEPQGDSHEAFTLRTALTSLRGD